MAALRPHVRHRPQRGRGARAFSLFELTFVLLILGIVSAALVPAIGGNMRSSRLRAAANVLAADIEYCASLCISRPNDSADLVFDVVHNKYTLVDHGTTTVLKHPMDSKDFVNDFLTGRNAHLEDVSITGVMCGVIPTTTLTFDSYGKPILAGDLVITLVYKTQKLTVTVSAATGDVTISG